MLTEPGWSPDERREHRWFHSSGAVVDILPIGGDALDQGELVWPTTGARMNLTGFSFLAAHSGPIEGLEESVRTPPAALIALLKMVAWLDRPQDRKKDLQDLGFLLDNYIDPIDDRLFTGEAAAEGLFDERANTYLLGLDIGQIVGGADRTVPEFLQRLRGDLGSQIALAQRWGSVDDEDSLLERLLLFERGLDAGTSS